MQRLDHEYMMRTSEAAGLKKLPSEYMKDMYYSSQPCEKMHPEALEQTADAIQAAADNEWFVRQDDILAIAVHETPRAESRHEVTRSEEEASRQILRSMFPSGDTASER